MRLDLADLNMGWREGLLLLLALLGLYMLFELLRIRRLRRRLNKPPASAALEPSVSLAAQAPAPALTPEPASLAQESAWGEPPAHLVQETFMRGVDGELAQMRDELDALRGEFAALREELRHEAAHLKASQTISPLYSDAMQMAMNGHSAEVIAERCGIARAEAELVVALVKNQEQ